MRSIHDNLNTHEFTTSMWTYYKFSWTRIEAFKRSVAPRPAHILNNPGEKLFLEYIMRLLDFCFCFILLRDC